MTLGSNGLATLNVTVVTSATAVAGVRNPTGIFAAVWLGMPAIVLLGSLRRKKLTRNTIVQLLGVFLILVGLLQAVGCGGGFTRTPIAPNGTPSGSYQILVQGSGSDGQTYSAIVPLNVGHQ